jgi:hypothetical protein
VYVPHTLTFTHIFLAQYICVFRPNLALSSYFRYSNNIKCMFLITEKQCLYFEIGTWFLLDNNLASQGSYTSRPICFKYQNSYTSRLGALLSAPPPLRKPKRLKFTGICKVHKLQSVQNLWRHAAGSAVGWGTTLQVGRSRVRFPMVSLEFFTGIILPAAVWPWGWLSL